MIWDARRRVYVRPDGSIVSPAELRRLIETYIGTQKLEIENEWDDVLIAGASPPLITRFFQYLREKIRTMHGAAGLTAYGNEMNPERWARISGKVASEIAYADEFERAVSRSREVADDLIEAMAVRAPAVASEIIERTILANPPSRLAEALSSVAEVQVEQRPVWDEMIWGQVGSRARLYADSVYATHENSVRDREQDAGVIRGRRVTEGDDSVCPGCEAAASDEYVPLGELLDIGDADCMTRCRCTIEFDYHGIEPLTIERGVYAGV